MAIKINTEKIIVQGEKRYLIKKLNALTTDKLPKIYNATRYGDGPYCSLVTNMHDKPEYIVAFGANNKGKMICRTLTIGEHYDQATFFCALKLIHQAGRKLQRINAKLKKENADWHGQRTFEI